MGDGRNKRRLTERLDLAPDALPGNGSWYPEDPVLGLLVDLVEELRPETCVALGGGPAVAVLARALARAGGGRVTALEHDALVVEYTAELLEAAGAADRAEVVEAELAEWDKHTLWYNRWALGRLPGRIDLMFIDGPPHFAGRSPRLPAGPELFVRLAPGAVVVLDDARRAKEKKALERWATDHPDLVASPGPGGCAVLRRG